MTKAKRPAPAEDLAIEQVQAVVLDAEAPASADDSAIIEMREVESAIASIETLDDAKEFIARVDALKTLLKAADAWHANAVKCLKMEAFALCRIADLGLEDALDKKTNRYRVVCWLSELGESERMRFIAMCDGGIDIVHVWKREVNEPHYLALEVEAAERYKDAVLERFDFEGVVELNEFDGHLDAMRRLPQGMVRGFKDEIRNELRKRGGHGVGDGNGTYMTAENAQDAINDIIETKVKSIGRDLCRLREVVGGKPTRPARIGQEGNLSRSLSDESAVNVLFCLAGLAEPDFGDCSEWGKAKLVSDIIGALGVTPYWLAHTLAKYSLQAGPDLHQVTGIDLRDYGWPEEAVA